MSKLNKLPEDATLEEIKNQLVKIKEKVSNQKIVMKEALKKKGIKITDDMSMDDIITKIDETGDSPDKPKIYGVRIDMGVSNPKNAVTYIEDAVGITPGNCDGYGGWLDKFPFNKIKPCTFKNGARVNYIYVENFQQIDETLAAVPTDVDVMIEFPKIYWKITKSGNIVEIRMSDTKIDDSYICPAHTKGTIEKDYVYIGAYEGAIVSNVLRSKYNTTQTVNKTISQFRNFAKAKGDGYCLYYYYAHQMVALLYTISHKHLNSQVAIGMGFTKTSNTGKKKSGMHYLQGMIFGEKQGTNTVKYLGIEGLWGNNFEFLDGIYIDASRNVLLSDNSVFNDTGEGYKNMGNLVSANGSGYITKIAGTSELGFLPTAFGGNANTYFCDNGIIQANKLAAIGDINNSGTKAGMFNINCSYAPSTYNANTGARLAYL